MDGRCAYRLGFKLVASGTNLVCSETLTAIAQGEGYFDYGAPVALLQTAPVLRRSGVLFTNSAGV